MKIFAAIFDLNGTLVETEYAHARGYQDALKPHGIDLTMDEFIDVWVTRGEKLDDFLKSIERNELLSKSKEIKRAKDDIFQLTLKERVKLMPGAREILEALKEARVSIGLDTSGSEENMELMLDLFDLKKFFDKIANGDTQIDEKKYGNKKWKASRLKFLADAFGILSSRCVMVGDAEKDIAGAKDAGMKVIAVPNEFTKASDFSKADLRVSSLSELTPESFKGLL